LTQFNPANPLLSRGDANLIEVSNQRIVRTFLFKEGNPAEFSVSHKSLARRSQTLIGTRGKQPTWYRFDLNYWSIHSIH